jgi:predicted dehydrogenase
MSAVGLDKIGVALVGTGFGQKVHLPALQAHGRIEVAAVVNRDRSRAEAIAATHGIPQACTCLEDAIALPSVQAVSISTPPFLHYDMAIAALNAGKHILLEKPTTLNQSQAQTLYDLAKQKNLAATMNFEFRYIPAWQRTWELLQENYVGTVRYVKVDWLVASRADSSRPWNWYAQKDQGGGALGAIGSHAFDYITWLFGEIRSVSARLTTAIPSRPDPVENNVLKPVTSDDTCNILLELSNQVPVQVSLSSVALQGRGHFVEIYGDRGTLILGSDNLADYVHGFTLRGSQNGQPLETLEIPDRLAFSKTWTDGRIAPIVRVIDRWVASMDAGEMLTPSLKEGVYSQQLMDACHRSNETNQVIYL